MTDPNPPNSKPRWFHPTPDKFLTALLPTVGLLWLSERYQWFPFNEHKNWTVLIAIAVVLTAIVLLLLWFGVSLIFRRRFQFGIRSLLVLTTVVAVVGSWFTVRMQQARRQMDAVAAIEKAGGYVDYHHYLFDADLVYRASTDIDSPVPSWLRHLLGEAFLSDVSFAWCADADDSMLAQLAALTRLEDLVVDGNHVTDFGLTRLSGMTSLRTLQIRTPCVTDARLGHLVGLRNLESLDLTGTYVTDAGLEHLRCLKSLQLLLLWSTEVTEVGVQDLQKSLPDCEIHY